jgi:hypothetical protein
MASFAMLPQKSPSTGSVEKYDDEEAHKEGFGINGELVQLRSHIRLISLLNTRHFSLIWMMQRSSCMRLSVILKILILISAILETSKTTLRIPKASRLIFSLMAPLAPPPKL